MGDVLYSCIGTTDPVRGLRDGGLMHIMRFYRPATVYLFLSAEIVERDQEDNRIDKIFSFVRGNWGGYDPKLIRIDTGIKDPSDMDALLDPMNSLLQRILRENPDSKVLLNLSSGTPQMQIILAQMAVDSRYQTEGIQVKNPERKAGTTERTNSEKYTVDEALRLNKDELPGTEDRCRVPRMVAVRREATRNQLHSLLSQRNYSAIAQLENELPAVIAKLARHLDYRSRFLLKEAEREASEFSEMELAAGPGDYPYPVYEMIEYFAMLKNLVHLKRYTDFMLRLNPFIVRFQEVLLGECLRPRGLSEADWFTVTDGIKKLNPDGIKGTAPELLVYMQNDFQKAVEARPVSIRVMNVMLRYFGVKDSVRKLLGNCEKANKKLRNSAAHDLFTITNEEILRVCGSNAETLVCGLEKTLTDALASYDDRNLQKRINIYDYCDRIIRDCL